MPIGPSHSGRSSSSSRSGFSSGGFSSRGGFSSSSGSHHYSHGPRHFNFLGRTVILSSGISTALSLLTFFIVFIGILFFGSFSSIINTNNDIAYYETQVSVMEEDAVYYNNLISNAYDSSKTNYFLYNAYFGSQSYYYYDDNPTNIGIYNAFTDDVSTWYFIVYEYTVQGQKYIGTTYTQFTSTQAHSLGGYIQIAYTIDDGEVYSINTSYTLAKNRDYTYAKAELENARSSKKSAITIVVISGLILAGLITAIVLILKTQIKKAKEKAELEKSKKQAEVNEAQAKAKQAERIANQFGRKCEYCNSDVPDNATVCPSCGSRQFK